MGEIGRRVARVARRVARVARLLRAPRRVSLPVEVHDDLANRVAFGARCTWWDTIDKTSTLGPGGLPCCPHCNGVLFEVESEEKWWADARAYDEKVPGYVEFLEWCRGKCYSSFPVAEAAYELEHPSVKDC